MRSEPGEHLKPHPREDRAAPQHVYAVGDEEDPSNPKWAQSLAQVQTLLPSGPSARHRQYGLGGYPERLGQPHPEDRFADPRRLGGARED